MAAPSTVERGKGIVAGHGDGHGDAHAVQRTSMVPNGTRGSMKKKKKNSSHDNMLLHQLQNKPLADICCKLFLFMIALGVLAFYRFQRAGASWLVTHCFFKG